MKKNVFRISTLGMLFALGSLNAQEQTEKLEKLDEVVVIATKFDTEKEKTGKIIYQITAADLETCKEKQLLMY